MITAQYPYHLPPIARNNCDYILVGQLNKQGIDLLTSEFMMGDISRKEFVDLYIGGTR